MTVIVPRADSPAAVSDADVIERSLTDRAQFATLFDRHADRIYRYVARRVGHERAEDLVADTFATAFERRAGYDLSYSDAAPWLYGIATNLLAGRRRAEARHLRALARQRLDADPESMAEAATRRVDVKALQASLGSALRGLPAPQRDVLLLYAWADLSYSQIGLALGVPAGTVRSRLSRARAELRRQLGEARFELAEVES